MDANENGLDRSGTTKTRPNHAPNLLLILLWHHFCYYKRHRILLVLSILMPFIVISLLYFAAVALTSSKMFSNVVMPSVKYLPCQHQTESPMSPGIFHYSSAYDCRNQYMNKSNELVGDVRNDLPSKTCVNESLTMYVEESLSDKKPYCPVGNRTKRYSSTCESGGWKMDGAWNTWLRGRILYYPKSSQLVQSVMERVKFEIDSYGRFLEIINKTSVDDFKRDNDLWPGGNFLKLEAATGYECFEKAENRVLGFDTKQEMLNYINTSGLADSFLLELLWAGLSFEGTEDSSTSFRYSVLRDSENDFIQIAELKARSIQDLLESAVLKLKLNVTTTPIAPMWKILPSKCWIRPDSTFYALVEAILPILCVGAFIFAPTNFLEQVLTEKKLKLREYLSIMGVSDLRLKLSWILFYMIFLIPASVLAAVYVHFLYGDFMINSDPTILIVQFLAFNLSQLFFSYFLSSFLKDTRRVTAIVVSVNILLASVTHTAFNYNQSQLNGAFLVAFRVLSFHCAVPFVLSIAYVIRWEEVWIGAKWNHFFDSPALYDQYGGFGEAILWMLLDCVLYLILAWYLNNVIPGEYGIRRPPYFFLQPSYWLPKRFGHAATKLDSIDVDQFTPDVEQPAEHAEPVLVIDRLTKMYGRHKIGVDRLSLSVYKKEITALLGQNGAGKSTTMNMLVGLLTPSTGRFTVAGCDSNNEMDEIKKLLGFVPQYDILYPSMNVKEHLQFFGWLKGLSKKEIETTLHALLNRFDMSHLKNTATTNLSGGQKRKLSVLTAFLGDPELVILDEPTTGVDPYSRRSIWDVLLQHRTNSAIILSTHFMDEADLLSDRVAIINEGTLRCVGSPLYLKNKYCQGYRVIAACKDETSVGQTRQFFTSYDSKIKLAQISGSDVTFKIPKEYARSEKMVQLVKSMEANQDTIGVSSFGIAEPTLEEAFFVVIDVDAQNKTSDASHGEQRSEQKENESSSVNVEYKTRSGVRLWCSQFWVLLMKRLLLLWRSPSTIISQRIIPIILIIFFLLFGGGSVKPSTRRIPIHIYNHYRSNVLFFQDRTSEPMGETEGLFRALVERGLGPRCPGQFDEFKCGKPNTFDPSTMRDQPITLFTNRSSCIDCKEYCNEGNARQVSHWKTPGDDLVYLLPRSMQAADWILAANQSDHWITGGFQYYSRNYSFDPGQGNTTDRRIASELKNTTPSSYVIIWTREETQMAMLNVFNNLLLQVYSEDKAEKIEAFYEPINFRSSHEPQSAKQRMKAITSMISGAFMLMLAITFSTSAVVVVVHQERTANLKELQFVNGAKPSAYWLANFVWEFLQFLLTMAILMILLAVVDNDMKPLLKYFVNIVICFGLQVIPFIFLISFRMKSTTGVNWVVMACLFLSMVAAPLMMVYEAKNPMMANIANIVLRFVPYYSLIDSFFLLLSVSLLNLKPGDPNDFDNLGRRLLQGYIMAVVWMLVLMFVEYLLNGLAASCKRKSSHFVYQPRGQDPDVEVEENRVLSGGATNEPVVVKNVSMLYPKTRVPAVDGVTFGVPRSQCFGLLGVNGAGKTTLFRIMTAFQQPTSGQVEIEGRNVSSEKLKLANGFSYCPQENTLFDNLTAWEHLKLFAAFRGIPSDGARALIKLLIQEVGLETHASKKTHELSGGNKRKLNFALALLNYTPVIFLDEPTSGMDPGARHSTWTCIRNAVSRGSSVVLTSHNMDECEALCHRLVIMAAGRVCCVGSVQYLKGKFGNVYTIKIKLIPQNENDDRTNAIATLKQHLATALPDSWLKEEHGSMLHYEVRAGKDSGLPLSALFGTLLECQRVFPGLVSDFTLSQVTLEQVFVGIAERNMAQQGQQPAQQQQQRQATPMANAASVNTYHK